MHRDGAVGVGLADAVEPDHRAAAPSSGTLAVRARDPTGRCTACPEQLPDRATTGSAASTSPTACRRAQSTRYVQHLCITLVSVLLGLRDRVPAGPAGPTLPKARGVHPRHHDRDLHDPVAGAVLAAGARSPGSARRTVVIGLGALLADDPGAQHPRRAATRCPAEVRESAPGWATAGAAAAPGRAPAGAAGDHGRAAGGHRLDGGADHGRLDPRLRRARQPDPATDVAATSRPRCWPRSVLCVLLAVALDLLLVAAPAAADPVARSGAA